MNLQATPTQIALLNAKREREMRRKAAALEVVQDAPTISLPDAYEAIAANKARIAALRAENSRLRASVAKERWRERRRASWRYMVRLAALEKGCCVRFAFADIIQETAAKYGFAVSELLSGSRRRRYTQARLECYWRGRNECLLSLPEIGRAMGGRDHTTVLHGVRMYEALRRFKRTGEPVYKPGARATIYPDLIITDGDE